MPYVTDLVRVRIVLESGIATTFEPRKRYLAEQYAADFATHRPACYVAIEEPDGRLGNRIGPPR